MFLALGSSYLLSTYGKKYLMLSCFYSVSYKMFNIFLLFYVRNILNHVLKGFVVFCSFVLHIVNLNIILWLGGVENILDWLTRDETFCSHWLFRKLWHPLAFSCQMFPSVTLVHRLWSIVDHIGSLPRTHMPCIICIINTIDLHIV